MWLLLLKAKDSVGTNPANRIAINAIKLTNNL
jgi:hypothetical protein